MPANDMITRRYEHPDGGRCMISFPAGWSRKCYYESTAANGGVHKWDFDSPQAAREGAIAMEGGLLRGGWRAAGSRSDMPSVEEVADEASKQLLTQRLIADDASAAAQGPNYITWLNQQCASLPAADRAGVVAEVLSRRAERARASPAAQDALYAEASARQSEWNRRAESRRQPRLPLEVQPVADFDQPKRRKIVLGE